MSDKQEEIKKQNVQADDQSIAIGSLDVGGDVSGNISIGHTIGYTADEVSDLIDQITSTFQPKPFDGRCPYKGLDAFEEDDAELFFGRENIVEDLVERVEDSRTVFITGPSGSGKSSLVRAGLIPALKRGGLKTSEHWLYETVKPGRDPLEALALAFSRLKSPELGKYFRENMHQTNVLNECAESALSGQKDQRLVLFFDQFEEVFTQVSYEETRTKFLGMLTHAAKFENGRVIILFAMRSDFVSNCATYPELNALLNQQFVQIGAMGPDELVSAIAQPALRVGLRIDPDLIAEIINDMQGEPGALPMMQFALKDLFDAEQAKGGMIALTHESYLQRGGIQKSLERHADASFAKLEKYEQELASSIFGGLIEIGRGFQDTRRTALLDELIPAGASTKEVEAIISKLADARLITTDDLAGKDMIMISHEKLIDAWPWLKKLVNKNRDVITLQNEIASDAREWEENKRDASYLYSGARLVNAKEKLKSNKLVLSGTAKEFVQTGFSKQQHEQRIRILSISGVIGLIVAGILLFSYISTSNSNKLAAHSQNSASTQAALASRAQAIAVTSQANADEANKQANIALARQIGAKAQTIFVTRSSYQMIASLLAVRSMQLYSNRDAQQTILNDTGAHLISSMIHGSEVTSVVFSPDGKYVVSGSYDGTARVWETATGKEVARMTHDNWVNSVAFSPDGKHVVSGSYDNTVRVWETASGKEVARKTHDARVNSVAFSPDGKDIISVAITYGGYTHSPDGKYTYKIDLGMFANAVEVFDIETGQQVARMTHDTTIECEICVGTYTLNINSASFSPNGEYIATGSDDRTARVWEILTGKEVALMTHDGTVTSVAFSPNGKFIVSGSSDGTARVWELPISNELPLDSAKFRINETPRLPLVIPSGKYQLWNVDGGVLVEDETGREVARLITGTEWNSNSFSQDGEYISSGSGDGIVRIWETLNFTQISQMNHGSSVTSVAFSPDGRYLVSGSFNGSINVWDTITGEGVASINGGRSGRLDYTVDFSLDGEYVGVYEIGKMWFWRAADLIKIECLNIPRNLTRQEWSQYIGNAPYEAICPNLPIEPEATSTPTITP